MVPLQDGEYKIMVSGIGGTGVVTIGALLGMAAHLEGKSTSIFDMTGLSQKNRAVFSHVRIAAFNDDLGAQKPGVGESDLALAFDAVPGLAKEAAMTLSRDGPKLVVNPRLIPTPALHPTPHLKFEHGILLPRPA